HTDFSRRVTSSEQGVNGAKAVVIGPVYLNRVPQFVTHHPQVFRINCVVFRKLFGDVTQITCDLQFTALTEKKTLEFQFRRQPAIWNCADSEYFRTITDKQFFELANR